MFAKKTVDGVLSAFNKAIADLSKVEQQQFAEASKQRTAAALAEQRADEAAMEATRAISVRAKLERLIGDA